MKKVAAIVLAAALLFTMTACGTQQTPNPPEGNTSVQQPPVQNPDASGSGSGEKGPSVTRPTSPKMVMIAGGSSTGTMFLLANAMSLILNDNYSDVFSASAQSTTGTPAIIDLLENGEADFGWGASNTVRDAYEGINSFEGAACSNLASVAYGYVQVVQIVVSNKGEINNIADLEGKSFGVSNAGSTTELNARLILGHYGLDYLEKNNVRAQYVGEGQASELISNNQLDGVLANAALNSSGMISLMSSGNCKLLSIDQNVIDQICADDAAFIPYTIPAGTYDNQPEDIHTLAVVNYIYCRADLSEELVYWFCDAIFSHNEDLVMTHAAAKEMVPENAGLGMTVPMHSGASKWYADHGYQVEQ